MSAWDHLGLTDLVEFSSGKPIKPGQAGPFQAYGSNGVIGGSSEARFQRGIIVGRVGAYCGSVAISRQPFWASDNTIVLEPKFDSDLDFLYYLLQNAQLNQHAGGAAQPLVTQTTLKRLIFKVPDAAGRLEVGNVLRLFDDLIENNTRRIEILEEMAQTIYREWFVNFRYPGHEDVPLVDSELGPIPEGWDVCRLGDVLTVDKGLSYKGAFLGGMGAPMVNLKCFSPGGGFRRSGTKPYSGESKPKHQIQPGDIVVANTDLTQEGGVIGNPAIVPRRGFENGGLISHHLFVLRHDLRTMPRAYLFELLASADFKSHARSTASGTTVLGFRTSDCEGYRFALPPADVRAAFSKAVEPIIDIAEVLLDQIEVLRTTRDLLLPRLISGEVDVSELDIDVGELVT